MIYLAIYDIIASNMVHIFITVNADSLLCDPEEQVSEEISSSPYEFGNITNLTTQVCITIVVKFHNQELLYVCRSVKLIP